MDLFTGQEAGVPTAARAAEAALRAAGLQAERQDTSSQDGPWRSSISAESSGRLSTFALVPISTAMHLMHRGSRGVGRCTMPGRTATVVADYMKGLIDRLVAVSAAVAAVFILAVLTGLSQKNGL